MIWEFALYITIHITGVLLAQLEGVRYECWTKHTTAYRGEVTTTNTFKYIYHLPCMEGSYIQHLIPGPYFPTTIHKSIYIIPPGIHVSKLAQQIF